MAVVPAAVAAETNTAAINGWCRSLSFNGGNAILQGGPATALLSTFDGQPNTLLQQQIGDVVFVNNEVRPRAGSPGVYETDYGFFRQFFFVEFGTLTLTLPTADANGVPDVVQVNRSGAAAISGNGRQESPQSVDLPVTGQLVRNANTNRGTYILAWTNFPVFAAFTNTLWVLHFDGQASYTRTASNVLRFQFTLSGNTGSSLVVTGSTSYTTMNADEVKLPQFKLRSGSRQYTVQPTTLLRTGNRYAGEFKFVDGLPDTAWKDYTDWPVEIIDTTDVNANGVPDLSDPLVVPDFMPPKVVITSPASNARLTNAAVTVRGTVTEDRALKEVIYSLNAEPFTNAAVVSNLWSAPVTLRPGENFFVVQATDAATNTSLAVTRKFVHAVLLPFTNTIAGFGSVTPNYNGRLLEVGKRYTITAVPAASNLFAFWSGGATSAVGKLTFTMSSNLVIVANFVTNPFLPLLGSYTGLFSEPGQLLHETSGYFSAKLTTRGAFSASLRRAGRTLRWSGQFALDGKATNTVRLSTTDPLLVTLCLDLTNGTERITGQIAEGSRVAELLANRTQPKSATNPAAPYAGKYTISFTPQGGALGPAGASLAAVGADTNGNLKLSGFLADGTKLAAKGAVSKDGLFPLQQTLYSSKGSVVSWLMFTNAPDLDLAALAKWTKPARPTDKRYSEGFTNSLGGIGNRYSFSELTNALATLTSNAVIVTALPTPDTTNAVAWNPTQRRMTNALGLTVTLNAATGLWDGIYPEPVRRQRLAFKTTLQKLADYYIGTGYVIQSNITGNVVFGHVP